MAYLFVGDDMEEGSRGGQLGMFNKPIKGTLLFCLYLNK